MFAQPCVLAPLPSAGSTLAFDLVHGKSDPSTLRATLERLRASFPLEAGVVGLGEPLTLALGSHVPGLRSFPSVVGAGCTFPATQFALWAFVLGDTASIVHERAAVLQALLGDVMVLREEVLTFKYRDGRDLSGYLDGTANPIEEKASQAAIVTGRGVGLDGATFVAAQKWIHDLAPFSALPEHARDEVIGRRIRDNEEMADAPTSAHVKRTEQEGFDPEAFVVRRSMPWGGLAESGLYFVAYGESLDRYERILKRMAGLDDGITDALLGFTRPVSGGYYWCPPTLDGKLDFRALG